MTEDLYRRGNLIEGSMSESLKAIASAPHNQAKLRDEKLLDQYEELIEAMALYENKLAAVGSHANRLSRRFSEMVKEGGTIISECGPDDHK